MSNSVSSSLKEAYEVTKKNFMGIYGDKPQLIFVSTLFLLIIISSIVFGVSDEKKNMQFYTSFVPFASGYFLYLIRNLTAFLLLMIIFALIQFISVSEDERKWGQFILPFVGLIGTVGLVVFVADKSPPISLL